MQAYKINSMKQSLNIVNSGYSKTFIIQANEEEVFDINVNEYASTPNFSAEDLSEKKIISMKIEQVPDQDEPMPEPEEEEEEQVSAENESDETIQAPVLKASKPLKTKIRASKNGKKVILRPIQEVADEENKLGEGSVCFTSHKQIFKIVAASLQVMRIGARNQHMISHQKLATLINQI